MSSRSAINCWSTVSFLCVSELLHIASAKFFGFCCFSSYHRRKESCKESWKESRPAPLRLIPTCCMGLARASFEAGWKCCCCRKSLASCFLHLSFNLELFFRTRPFLSALISVPTICSAKKHARGKSRVVRPLVKISVCTHKLLFFDRLLQMFVEECNPENVQGFELATTAIAKFRPYCRGMFGGDFKIKRALGLNKLGDVSFQIENNWVTLSSACDCAASKCSCKKKKLMVFYCCNEHWTGEVVVQEATFRPQELKSSWKPDYEKQSVKMAHPKPSFELKCSGCGNQVLKLKFCAACKEVCSSLFPASGSIHVSFSFLFAGWVLQR